MKRIMKIKVYRRIDSFWRNALADIVCRLPDNLQDRIWLSKWGRKLFFDSGKSYRD